MADEHGINGLVYKYNNAELIFASTWRPQRLEK